jgi:hypothetical protein
MEGRTDDGRGALMGQLARFPMILRRVVERVPEELRSRRPAAGSFALVEHVWHCADLEEEGFARRIERLLRESHPDLPDFRGDEVARQRRYIEQPIGPALGRFQKAREKNRQRLAAVDSGDWLRGGTQERVGEITLHEIPKAMLAHDRAHANELVNLLRGLRLGLQEELSLFAREEP